MWLERKQKHIYILNLIFYANAWTILGSSCTSVYTTSHPPNPTSNCRCKNARTTEIGGLPQEKNFPNQLCVLNRKETLSSTTMKRSDLVQTKGGAAFWYTKDTHTHKHTSWPTASSFCCGFWGEPEIAGCSLCIVDQPEEELKLEISSENNSICILLKSERPVSLWRVLMLASRAHRCLPCSGWGEQHWSLLRFSQLPFLSPPLSTPWILLSD